MSLYPLGSCVIFRDSIVNSIDEKRLPRKPGNVKMFHFSRSRATIEDMSIRM